MSFARTRRQCQECGGWFEPTREDHVYCDKNCGRRARYLQHREEEREEHGPPQAKCPVCSTEFEPIKSSQIYCGRSCATKAGYRRRLGRSIDEEDCGDRRKALSPEDVEVIKQLISEGYTNAKIAETFGVAPSTISAIKNRRNWA